MSHLYVPPPSVNELAETFAKILARFGVNVTIIIDKGENGYFVYEEDMSPPPSLPKEGGGA